MILDAIVEKRKMQLAREQQAAPFKEIKARALRDSRCCISLFDALKQSGLSVIAEVKKASPSKGVIQPDFHPVETARAYVAAGASAVSVLTEESYFQGSSAYLQEIRQAVDLPLLRKDFLIDPYQIYEAKLLGADAVLLIAALLNTETLREFRDIAHGLGMECLAEVHNREELDRVLQADFRIVGINNRDLQTFQVSLDTTAELAKSIPKACAVVSESGIGSREDMRAVRRYGADAVLIGETLMRSGNPGQVLRDLLEDNGHEN